MVKALVLEKNPDFAAVVREVDEAFLDDVPEGGVTVDVEYSTVNFKDALAITDRAPIVRKWPMIPGIDGAGRVRASDHAAWRPGDRVLVNGFGVGEVHRGCLAQCARLHGDWLVPIPEAFDARQAMAIGTAGYTAMLCVLALERHGALVRDGDVLVTGATGGVGSVAVAVLAGRGHRVVAATGKPGEADYLRALGAASVIDRAELAAPGKPLQRERWTAVVDAVGSHTLVNACAQTRYGGAVAACGLAQGNDFPATVLPFILRAVSLLGVDSVMAPMALRLQAWQRLASDLDPGLLERMVVETGLEGAIASAQALMEGRVRGRTVVRTA